MTRAFSTPVLLLCLLLLGPVPTCCLASMNNLVPGMVDTARSQAHTLAQACEAYRASTGSYPSTSEGLAALVHPSIGKPLMTELPLDPWGNAFLYRAPGQVNETVDVRSAGPDGVAFTDDDIGNW